jgi:hypothetical protein
LKGNKNMPKIVVLSLHYISVKELQDNLSPTEVSTVWGGSPYIYISNNSDSVNINSTGTGDIKHVGTGGYSINDSKFNTIDYSRSNYNNFGVMYVGSMGH